MNLTDALKKLQEGYYIRENNWPDMLHLRIETNNHNKLVIKCYEQVTTVFIYDLDILTTGNWVIYKHDTQMEFTEAVKLLKARKRLQLDKWTTDTWIEMSEDKDVILIKTMQPKNFMPLLSCFLSNEWSILEW